VSKVAEEEYNSLSDEDEAVANDLDMHSLILGRSHEPEPEPPTADEVIKEIDFIMQVSTYPCLQSLLGGVMMMWSFMVFVFGTTQ